MILLLRTALKDWLVLASTLHRLRLVPGPPHVPFRECLALGHPRLALYTTDDEISADTRISQLSRSDSTGERNFDRCFRPVRFRSIACQHDPLRTPRAILALLYMFAPSFDPVMRQAFLSLGLGKSSVSFSNETPALWLLLSAASFDSDTWVQPREKRTTAFAPADRPKNLNMK